MSDTVDISSFETRLRKPIASAVGGNMMIRILGVVATVLLVGLVPVLGQAEEAKRVGHFRAGPYVALGGGVALFESPGFFSLDPGNDLSYGDFNGDEVRGSGTVRVGYRLREPLAIEVQNVYLDTSGANTAFVELDSLGNPVPSTLSQAVAGGAWLMTVNLRIYLTPPVYRVQPLLVLGGGLIYVDNALDGNSTSAMGRFGGGIAVHITDHIALEVEAAYLKPTKEVGEVFKHTAVDAALVYRF